MNNKNPNPNHAFYFDSYKDELISDTDDLGIYHSYLYEKLFFERIITNYWVYVKEIDMNYIIFENNMKFLYCIKQYNNDNFRIILTREYLHGIMYVIFDRLVVKSKVIEYIVRLVDSMLMYSLLNYKLFI